MSWEVILVIGVIIGSVIWAIYEKISFEKKVKRGSKIKTARGDYVQSFGEKLIADFLYKNGINYIYDKPVRFSFFQRRAIRPDFYLPDYNVYIEYWGMEGDKDYDRKAVWKRKIYEKYKKKLISIYKEQKDKIPEILTEALSLKSGSSKRIK